MTFIALEYTLSYITVWFCSKLITLRFSPRRSRISELIKQFLIWNSFRVSLLRVRSGSIKWPIVVSEMLSLLKVSFSILQSAAEILSLLSEIPPLKSVMDTSLDLSQIWVKVLSMCRNSSQTIFSYFPLYFVIVSAWFSPTISDLTNSMFSLEAIASNCCLINWYLSVPLWILNEILSFLSSSPRQDTILSISFLRGYWFS